MQNNKFRLNAQNLFLTYPHCDLDKQQALELVRTKLLPKVIINYLVAQEKHEDGTPHIHMLLYLDDIINITDPNRLDLIGSQRTYHGNYQGVRSVKKSVAYLTKSDQNPLSNWETKKDQMKKAEKAELILKEGLDPIQAVAKFPELLFSFSKFTEDLRKYKEMKEALEAVDLPMWLPNKWSLIIPTFMKRKKNHWWIWSQEPNKGKTTWAVELNEKYRVCMKSGDFTYWRITGEEELIILDEYNSAGLKYSQLNQICDGTFEFRVFMGGVVPLKKKPIVIVLSNQSLSVMYPNMNSLLYARFNEKEI